MDKDVGEVVDTEDIIESHDEIDTTSRVDTLLLCGRKKRPLGRKIKIYTDYLQESSAAQEHETPKEKTLSTAQTLAPTQIN